MRKIPYSLTFDVYQDRHESHDRVDRSRSVARSVAIDRPSRDHKWVTRSIGGLQGTYPLSTVNNGNRFAGSIARSRAMSSHGSFSEMAVQAVHIPGGLDRWDYDMGMSSESTFLCVYIRPWSLDRSRSQDRASMPTMSHIQGRRHGIDSPLIVIWDMIRTGGRVSTNPVGNGVAKSA